LIGTPRRLRLQQCDRFGLITTLFHVKCCEASVLFRPCFTVISGSKHPTSLTHNGMCSGEDVIVATINGQRRNVGRCQTYVGKRPTVAVVSGAIHAFRILLSRQRQFRPERSRETKCCRSPNRCLLASSCRHCLSIGKHRRQNICSCKNVATRIGRQRANIA
jgi:hypothetical protein